MKLLPSVPFKLLLAFCFLCFNVQGAELRVGNAERDLFLNNGCQGCGLLRSRMRRINADDTCVDACRLLGSARRSSGWECGTCGEWNPPDPPKPAFDATLDLENVESESLRTLIRNAAAQWNQVIIGDVPDIDLTGLNKDDSFFCDARAIPNVVDDILICVNVEYIDGKNGIVGQAGAEYWRVASKIPLIGGMTFDVDDVADMVQQGLFDEIVLHEMGHVLGISSIFWQAHGLVDNLEPPCSYKLESIASNEWQAMSGCVGTSVPIENGGGPGAACAHFDEGTLNDELMTGYLDEDAPILSRLTVATLQDLGYEVNYDAAQPFTGVEGLCAKTEAEETTTSVDSGLEKAMQFGTDYLKERAQHFDSGARRIASNVEYIGDQSVSVVYMDDSGKVRHVTVTNV